MPTLSRPHPSDAPDSIILVRGYIDHIPATLMADSGASHNFASPEFVARHKLPTTTSPLTCIRMGDGNTISAPGQQVLVQELHLAGQQDDKGQAPLVVFRNVAFHLVPLAPYCDAVLGMEFFNQSKLQLNYQPTADGDHECTGITVSPTHQSHISEATSGTAPLVPSPLAVREIHHDELFCLSEKTSALLNSLLAKQGKATSKRGQSDLEQESDKITKMIMTEFKSVFMDPDGLPPPSREIEGAEHTITFEAGKPLPRPRPFIRLSQEKEVELEKQIKDMITQGYIRPSSSRFASATFLVPKGDGGYRMVVDYRAINNVTEKDSYPLPLAEDLFAKMKDAVVFSKIDLKSGFYQIPLAKKDWAKTAFRTSRGLYEYTVVPMGLCNAPATFMRFMNNIFKAMIDDNFVVVFMDDIVIYSKSIAEHAVHLRKVLTELKKQRLYAKASKCSFFTRSVQFLGHILTPEGVHPMPEKREAIAAWPIPKDKEQLRSFLGLCNYYSKFIDGYSRIASPLTNLTGAVQPWEWTQEVHTVAFEQLKAALNSAPCLIHPRNDVPFVLGTDASDFAIGAVLMQDHGKGLQPIGYYGRKLNKAERNYAVYDKEMLAVVYALNNWHYLLEGSPHPVQVRTDHQPLSHFATAPVKPNLRSHGRWQRWLEQLGMFKLEWGYVKGTTQWADPISRRPDFVSEEEDAVVPTPAAAWSYMQYVEAKQNREPLAATGLLPWLHQSACFSALHENHRATKGRPVTIGRVFAIHRKRPPPLRPCASCQQLGQSFKELHYNLHHAPKKQKDQLPHVLASYHHMLANDTPGATLVPQVPSQFAAARLTARQMLMQDEGKQERRALTLKRYLESHEGRVAGAPPPDSYGNINMPTRRCAALVQRWSTADREPGQPRQRIPDQCRQLTRFGAYCWTHLGREEQLRLKTSTIPGAGRGLFALRHIRPGEMIGWYTGDYMRGDFSNTDDPSTGGTYYLQLNNQLCIDAARTDTHVSRFINDPRGSGKRANCIFAVDGRTSLVRVRATRHIQPGQELLLSYGQPYWNAQNSLLQWSDHHSWSSPRPGKKETSPQAAFVSVANQYLPSTNLPPHSSSSKPSHRTVPHRHVENAAAVSRLTSSPPTLLHMSVDPVIHSKLSTSLGPASQYVLDTLAETAYSELASLDTVLYCVLSIDFHNAVTTTHRQPESHRVPPADASMSAITTRRQQRSAGNLVNSQPHSTRAPVAPSPSPIVPPTRARAPLPAKRVRVLARTDAAPPVVATPIDSSPAQEVMYQYIDKWMSQASTTQFTAMVRQAAATDPDYQAMLIAVKLSPQASTDSQGERGTSTATPDLLGPVVAGRLVKLVVKYKQRIQQHTKLGFRYEASSDGLLYLYSNTSRRLIVPMDVKVRTVLLAYLHDHDGHHGRDKVMASAKLRVWWQGMDADVRTYIASCQRCQQVRDPPGKEQGIAMPLKTPEYPWQWVTMDFVGPFPEAISDRGHTHPTEPAQANSKTSKTLLGHDMILVFVDRFTKMKHFAACKSTITASQTVQLFEQNVVRLHGWPEFLTSDRGAVFTSKYWKNYFLRVGVKLRMTAAYHPETDGQSERDIRTLQKVLSSYVNTRRDDWDLHLPLVEFTINSIPSVATGKSPFKILYGVEANKPIDIALANLLSTANDAAATTNRPDPTVLGTSSTVSSASRTHTRPSTPSSVHPHASPDTTLRAHPSVTSSSTSSSSDAESYSAPPVTDSLALRQAALHIMGTTTVDDSNPAVDARLAELKRIVLETRLALSKHQQSIAASIAKRRRAVNYTAGEQVMLSTQHLVLPTDKAVTSTKLRPKYVGPYSILRVINPNVVELQLNSQDTFFSKVNVSRLKPYCATPPSFADRPQPVIRPPPAISGEGQEAEWSVESIVGYRYNRQKKRHEYCVKWLGYDESEATWEPIEHLYDNQYFLQFITERPTPTAVQNLVDTLQQRANQVLGQ